MCSNICFLKAIQNFTHLIIQKKYLIFFESKVTFKLKKKPIQVITLDFFFVIDKLFLVSTCFLRT